MASPFTIKNFENEFLLLKSENTTYLQKLGRAIFRRNFDFIDEVIVAETEICLQLNNRFIELHESDFKDLSLEETSESKTILLPVYFHDHEDWKIVCEKTGWSKKHIVQELVNTKLKVAMFGFLPGFTYLDGLSEELQIDRKAVPAKRVEANSVAIGGKYLGVYAIKSPGGWHVIGKTPVHVLNRSSTPPVDMNLGDLIQVQAISETEFELIKSKNYTLKSYNQ